MEADVDSGGAVAALTNAVLSAALNVVLLAGLPFLVYFVLHRRRHGRSAKEIAERAGLRLGEPKYVALCLACAFVGVAVLVLWPPPLEPFLRAGSPQRQFAGLGLGGRALVMALLYGLVKTGFSEEFLFRGLIAGSLARRLPLVWANVVQALVFLAPHVLVVFLMPEMWGLLPLVLAGALFTGWVRIRSGSIVGPWLLHGSLNVAISLSVAVRSAA
jgi:membrane protease YdiL (CAAX protease family)